MVTFRNLTADEIEVRVQSCKNNGLILLLYVTARACMDILDEQVGAENWTRSHFECKGRLFCSVGIKSGDEWIQKADCGVESEIEKEKGESSDSFKRACTVWGIGRELYSSPFIWIPAAKCNIEQNGTNRYICKDRFAVQNITIENKKITALKIFNSTTGKLCYDYKKTSDYPQKIENNEDYTNNNDYTCKDCGKVLIPCYGKTTEELNEYMKKKYGRTLCPECAVKEKQKQLAIDWREQR